MEAAVLPPDFRFLHDEHSLLELHGDQFLCLKKWLLVSTDYLSIFVRTQVFCLLKLKLQAYHVQHRNRVPETPFLPTLSDVGL